MKRFFLNLIYICFCWPLAWGTVAGATTLLGDTVLTADTHWRGTVEITGVVVVGRRATLTIEPGTRVLFHRVDSNHDGIGDSELRVLGGLQAQGRATAPIVFRSAETRPRPRDWSYVLLFTSGQKNRISHCRFENAFSGLQVHFSSAEVDHNLFINNNEGIRFGRAKLTLRANTFTGNHIGIRFTRMEGPAEITGNEVSANDTGVFLVPSGQNIVDFFEPGRNGRPWNVGHLMITDNNIHDNRDYDLKLGAKQMWDLDVRGNWWGEGDGRIYDHAIDPELGRALTAPRAAAPLPAGSDLPWRPRAGAP